MTEKKSAADKKLDEKADDALSDSVPEEFKNTDPDATGHAHPGAVLEGSADAEPVVKSHQDK